MLFQKTFFRLIPLLAVIFLTACGGGESGENLPAISSTANVTATEGVQYTYDVDTSDVTASLIFELIESPDGMTINAESGLISWAPTTDQVGSQSITVKVSDSNNSSLSTTHKFNIVVAASPETNNEPTISQISSAKANVGELFSYTVSASDDDGDVLTFSLEQSPTGMKIIETTGEIIWTPTSGQENSQFKVIVSVSDNGSPSRSAKQEFIISVEIDASVVVNETPIINSIPNQGTFVGDNYSYNVQATDSNGDSLIYALLTSPNGMTIHETTGKITWTPGATQVGSDIKVIVKVEDNGSPVLSAEEEFNIKVESVNFAPVIESIANEITNVDVAYIYQVKASDTEGGTLSYTLATAPNGMEINSASGVISWTSNTSQIGEHTVVVSVTDDDASPLSDTEEFKITVMAVPNTLPVASGDVAQTDEDVVLTIPASELLANDIDADGDELIIINATAISGFTHGTVSVSGSNVIYTPESNYSGSASFKYIIADGKGGQADATVLLNVNAVNDAPVAVNDEVTTAEDVAVVINVADLLANDTDVELDNLQITSVEPNDRVALNGSDITYTPEADFNGVAQFTYLVIDNRGGNNTGTVVVNVTPVADTPVANADSYEIDEDETLSLDVLTNDVDVDDDDLTIKVVTDTGNMNGITTIVGQAIVYVPNADYNGSASFEYTISDGTEEVTAEVTLNILAQNDAPIIEGFPSTKVGAGQFYSFFPIASDVDLDDVNSTETLTFSIINKPVWANFSTTTGELSGTIGVSDVTTQGIVISVVDAAQTNASLPIFEIAVAEQAASPTFFPPAGQFTNDVYVNILSDVQNASIHYTTDNTEPTINSPLFIGEAIILLESATIKAKAFRNDLAESDVASAYYVVEESLGGVLGGFASDRSGSLNLTNEGTSDWAHWGLDTVYSFNHKAEAKSQISKLSYIVNDLDLIDNQEPVKRYDIPTFPYPISWSEGEPTVTETGVTSGLYTDLINDGFTFTLPAGTSRQVLKVYLTAYNANGRFEASLSDGSAVTYIDSIDSPVDATHKVVRVTFAAASENQTLTIKYVLKVKNTGSGNISLQAATLDGTPVAASPTFETKAGTYTDATTVVIAATGVDNIYYTIDGSEPNESSSTPYTTQIDILSDITIKARAYKSGYLPSDIVIATYKIESSVSGGNLDAFFSPRLGSVDLTTEGTADWVHWGLDDVNSFNRKGGVEQQLSSFTIIGGAVPTHFPYAFVDKVFTWSDGSPTLGTPLTPILGTTSGVFILDKDNGFSITALADTTKRTLNIYLGAFKSKGKVVAKLSDGSIPDYIAYIDSPSSATDQFLVIEYSSATNGETITVDYTLDTKYHDLGNIAIQATTMSGGFSKVSTPVISPGGNSLFANETITIASTTDGTEIYYTLDGSEPASGPGNLYSGPFSLVSDSVVKAIAVKGGLVDSNIASASYTVDLTTGCAVNPTKIMPLGDSITLGSMGSEVGEPVGGFQGYREFLYSDLTTAGYNFDFVGSLSDGVIADPDHQGMGGVQANEIATGVYSWLTANPADYVLLHIGTNDVNVEVPTSDAAARVDAILREIDRYDENIRVILARIINADSIPADKLARTEFNNEVAAIAGVRIAQGDRITIVDMESALNYSTDMEDTIHPNVTGYGIMSDVWYNSLNTLLPVPVCP